MAPGGRLASESPVRRHEGALRVPRAGGGGGAPVPTGSVYQYESAGVGSLTWGPDGAYPNGKRLALITCLGYPIAKKTAVTPPDPTEWEVLLSGNVGSLYYYAAALNNVPEEFTTVFEAVGGSGSTPMVMHMFDIETTGSALVAAVDVGTAVTSHPFKSAPSAAWGSVWQHNIYLAPNPAGSASASPTYGAYPYLYPWGHSGSQIVSDYAPQGYDGLAYTGPIDSVRTSSVAWDSLRFVFGATA